MLRTLLSLSILLCGAALAPAQNGTSSVIPPSAQRVREVPVFWFIGQSNCAGGSNGFWLANPFAPGNRWPQLAAQSFTRIWWQGASAMRPNAKPAWEDYRTGQLTPINNSNFQLNEANFGPEASFGDAAARALGEPVFLFKFVAIAPLHPDAPITFSRRPDRETVFDTILSDWQQAARALRQQGLVPRVRGICWIQGEYDLGLSYAPSYAQNLTQLIADFRAAILRIDPDNGVPRFVISRMHDRHVPRSAFSLGEATLRAAQAQVASTVPGAVLVDTDDLPLDLASPNLVHFDSVGDVLLGFRLFSSWSDRDTAPRR
ncbi:MAG: sialate O-acetylesterase [Planctomycetota bacterium]